MIAWGNELLRDMSGFLGWCLNLRLMDPFQGSPLVFFVKGSKVLSPVLEHVTGARTQVELYLPLFPVYH